MTVKCLICGIERKALWKHLVEIHNVTSDEYRSMYPGAFTCIRSLSKSRSESMTRRNLENWKDESYAKHMSKIYSDRMKSWWTDPEFYDKVSSTMSKTMFRLHREGKIKPPLWTRFKPYRSAGEVMFVDFLRSEGLEFEYEPCSFPYTFECTVHSYTPDFYVYDWDSFVEFKFNRSSITLKDIAKLDCFPEEYNILYIFKSDMPFITIGPESGRECLASHGTS